MKLTYQGLMGRAFKKLFRIMLVEEKIGPYIGLHFYNVASRIMFPFTQWKSIGHGQKGLQSQLQFDQS